MKFWFSMQRTRKDNTQLIRWILPPEHCTKLNVDGSLFRENNNAACGELWGIVKGFQIVITQNFQHIIIESNSWSAINFIKEGCLASHLVRPLLEDINILSSRLQHV
ncbi:hypothetical protein Ahy_A06g028986 [Arachis hypogaea]|uniref:RNase H type-1 domain-containing protein n=1 Tax=Arachis hypogaea TaxID=3818 RepID=A0A445CS59_ARAHY|nr:hypothetical protein Ahy_A06g028986 [Arachis hypogaea]